MISIGSFSHRFRLRWSLVISVDEIQPEKRNETLHVIQEVLSCTIMVVENVKGSSTQDLETLIRPVVEMDSPIFEFVSE